MKKKSYLCLECGGDPAQHHIRAKEIRAYSTRERRWRVSPLHGFRVGDELIEVNR